ncbi:MAG: hypothetical protein RIQ89_335 [Bacteroidota bacterium]
MIMVHHVAIIGGGFSGMMLALQLKLQSKLATHIHLINNRALPGRGIAYQNCSDLAVLNVRAERMSAWPDDPLHFCNWLLCIPKYKSLGLAVVRQLFIPRKIYGNYLDAIWENAKQQTSACDLNYLCDTAVDVMRSGKLFLIQLKSGKIIYAHQVVLATGNDLPARLNPIDEEMAQSDNYYADPWNEAHHPNILKGGDSLIMGNGLTMIDISMMLLKNHFKNKIYCISPNGFSLLPHLYPGLEHPPLLQNISEPYTLDQITKVFFTELRKLKAMGLTAEPLINSFNTITQSVWLQFSLRDKQRFLQHLKNFWQHARHRVPAHIYNFLQRKQAENKILFIAGKLRSVKNVGDKILVEYHDKSKWQLHTLTVDQLINCTGPNTNIAISGNALLLKLYEKNIIYQDGLKLGLNATPEGRLLDDKSQTLEHLYTIGNNLKGVLWESTAVPDLRIQTAQLANILIADAAKINLRSV